ncbi:hypothetical protein DL769_010898 [Monosporascus sp. CRB-8-3]|nr:hypothetical protein DL769_010898 [Monosporascus sp. CRB-8-3]
MSIDPSQSSVIPVTGKKLSNRDTWPDWYMQLRYHARFRGIWQYIDPNAVDAPHLGLAAPAAPATTSAAPEASSSSGEATQVDSEILSSYLRELDLLHPDDDPSIQRIIRLLKERLAHTDGSTTNTVQLQYIAVSELAKTGYHKPAEWYAKWH